MGISRSAGRQSDRPFNRAAHARMLAATAITAFATLSSPALAQTVAEVATDAPGEDIIVTGSRIVRDGYDAPTPVSVISTKELKSEAPANISDFVNTLPAVRGSSTAASSNGSLSNGAAGINTVNLRNLGAVRTLVLFDGQRSVASATTGTVDVNTFPQALIERVEVVTGGASSAYGSDAVSGVVNFILDKKFTGLKAEYEYGVTTYGDGPNHKISVTGGMPFAGGKGHVLLSGETFTQKGIQSIDRDWNDSGFFQIDNPAGLATDGRAGTCTAPPGYVAGTPIAGCGPARYIAGRIGTSQFTPGGLIGSATLGNGTGGQLLNAQGNPVSATGAALAAVRGTYFGLINPATGRATTSNLLFGPINGQWMIGGDYNITSAGHRSSATLLPSEKRSSAFGRLSYEFSPAIEIYGQFAYSKYRGQSYYQQTPTTGVNIRQDNAYLPDSVRAAMVANNLYNIQIGTSNIDIPPQGSDNTREVFRYVAGASGKFGLIGADWSWDAYYQKGVVKTNELLTNAWNINRMALATDAVFVTAANQGTSGLAIGSIACRSTLTAPTNGCIPLNRLGVGAANPAAVAYVLYNGLQPLRTQELTQDVAAINFSTNNLFDIWAGPVSIAFGAEYRNESVDGFVDPLFQPIVTGGVTSGTWIYGNYLATKGEYNVKEAYLETVVPIIKGIDFNGAVRATNYSTSGTVTTWKAGLTWQPIDDIKLRGTISRDIRAPNLGELFAPGVGRTNTVNVPTIVAGLPATRTDQFNESTVGNSALVPEIAQTYAAGAIFTPNFLPGFNFSVDYYNITLDGAISSLTAQTLIDQCYTLNITSACSFISTTGGRGVTTPGLAVTSIEIKPINFVTVKTSGVDFEASYRRQIGPGTLGLRALASYAISLYTNNGIDVPTEAAGQNGGGLPTWTYRLSAGYDMDSGLGLQFIGRGVSAGVYDNSYVVCSTSCPVSTVANRTVNQNSIAGAFYLDFNINYSFKIDTAKGQVFLAVKNLFDTDPVLVGNGPTGNNTPAYPQTNRALYDVLGRVFRLGVRFSL
ncbi:MAG: TonB-dependent receptor [Sphingomonadales bacterium]